MTVPVLEPHGRDTDDAILDSEFILPAVAVEMSRPCNVALLEVGFEELLNAYEKTMSNGKAI
jgi:hypothetical protein